MAGIVKQNLYSVKIATYKDSHGWKTETKQSESPGANAGSHCSKTGGATQPVDRRHAVPSRLVA
jgi:hypothetical protein